MGTATLKGGYAGAEASVLGTLRKQLQVIHALVLHDIKARFFGNGLGYIMMIMWPGAHLAILLTIYTVLGRAAPYGDQPILYFSIGVLPYIIWNYTSRFTMLGVVSNRSFLQYPIVTFLDLIIARQCLETVTCTIVTVALVLFLTGYGINWMPNHPDQAALALLSAWFLGIGFGVLGAGIVRVFPMFHIVYVGILILFWISSGVVINPEAMPTEIGNMLAWNPLLHCIEWLRVAYYDDFPGRLLDKTYVLYCAAITLTLGLVLERAQRLLMAG